MRKNLFLAFVAILFTVTVSKAQSEVSVNNFKGTPTIRIPLIEIGVTGLIHPIQLTYHGRSVKVRQGDGEVGMGWNLDAGGSIERVLNGLPDEVMPTGKAIGSGWRLKNNHNVPINFPISDDNNDATCADEVINHDNLLYMATYPNDTEPDRFVVNAPGLNCTLVIDNNNNFKVIPAQDIKIELVKPYPQYEPHFIITTAAGIKYTFQTMSKTTKTVSRSRVDYDLFKKEYLQFQEPVSYIGTWYLSEIASPGSTNPIRFNYSAQGNRTENRTSGLGFNQIEEVKGTWELFGISNVGTSQEIKINREFNRITSFDIMDGQSTLSTITLERLSNDIGGHHILESISETAGGCTSKLYRFDYYGISLFGSTALPDWREPSRFDAWGNLHNNEKGGIYVYPGITSPTDIYRPYEIPNYQGEKYPLEGTTPHIDEAALQVGLMSKITYPNGGSSTFEYETNRFWDQDGNAEVKGAGVRIRKISFFDGISPEKTIVNEYAYNIPGQNRTSGTILSLPQYAVTTNYFDDVVNSIKLSNQQILGLCSVQSAKYWNYHTIISKEDLSDEDHDVRYEYVTVKGNMAGRTEYHYSIPANLWTQDNNSMTYLGSKCTTPKEAGLPVRKGFAKYPFSYKESFNYAEGLLLQSKMFSDLNVPVKTKDYEYEDFNPNEQIYGLAYDWVYGNLVFSKYAISVNSKILKNEKATDYDSGSGIGSLVSEVSYDNSAPGRGLRAKTTVGSNKAVSQLYYTYSGDFSLQASETAADPFVEGIYLLNQNNIKNIVVEQLLKIKKPGDLAFKTYKAELNLFAKNPINNYPVLTESKLFNSIGGVPDFSALRINDGQNGKSLVYNGSFRSNKKFLEHNQYNFPQTITENRIKKTLKYYDHFNVPMAEFLGAESINIVYNKDLVTENLDVFKDYSSDGRTDYQAFVLRSDNSFYKSFMKPTGAKFYTLSIWVKCDAASTVNVLVDNSIVATINCDVTGKYVFYQKQIDVSALPANSVLKLKSLQTVKIDDVVFCPQEVSYLLSTYRFPYGKTSETSSSGKTMFYEYDAKGRPSFVKDGDKNIIKYNRYQNYNTASLSADFYHGKDEPKANEPVTFGTLNSCLSGVKYNWNFGDGTLLETFATNVTHTFLPGGPYTVTLTASHPDFGTKTQSTVYTLPLFITICASGEITKDLCGIRDSEYGDCSEPGTYGVVLKVTSINGAPPNDSYTYSWSVLRNGMESNTGPIASSPVHQLNPGEAYYVVQCMVQSPTGGTVGYSQKISINYYRSDSNCAQP
ncbi:PKD domain-containing protein [Pedobacter steynii]|uniref:PKD domain-containing protein n=1 Tax=Pedobacter steynii TaxID=430522 RepID=A0A1G9SS18_9SPHI|nr:PKD domain-containing protein [Pedobacter steynii]NQX37351.1 PKD domain-containing protein [Pedobacter steynii]SDM37645.1 PKD domain-containing protein [Pedobacter steynii]